MFHNNFLFPSSICIVMIMSCVFLNVGACIRITINCEKGGAERRGASNSNDSVREKLMSNVPLVNARRVRYQHFFLFWKYFGASFPLYTCTSIETTIRRVQQSVGDIGSTVDKYLRLRFSDFT